MTMEHQTFEEFSISLVSNASMNIFPDNTLACFVNVFNEEIVLEGDWRVGLQEIIFPAFIKNVTDTSMYVFRKDDPDIIPNEGNISKGPWRKGNLVSLVPGCYTSTEDLLNEIKSQAKIDINETTNSTTGILELSFHYDEGI